MDLVLQWGFSSLYYIFNFLILNLRFLGMFCFCSDILSFPFCQGSYGERSCFCVCLLCAIYGNYFRFFISWRFCLVDYLCIRTWYPYCTVGRTFRRRLLLHCLPLHRFVVSAFSTPSVFQCIAYSFLKYTISSKCVFRMLSFLSAPRLFSQALYPPCIAFILALEHIAHLDRYYQLYSQDFLSVYWCVHWPSRFASCKVVLGIFACCLAIFSVFIELDRLQWVTSGICRILSICVSWSGYRRWISLSKLWTGYFVMDVLQCQVDLIAFVNRNDSPVWRARPFYFHSAAFIWFVCLSHTSSSSKLIGFTFPSSVLPFFIAFWMLIMLVYS